MRIAIAREGQNVSAHFGHCEGFEVFTINEGAVKDREFIANPGHRPGFLPDYLAGRHIDIVASGSMGATAQSLFKEKGINVIVGVEGGLEEAIQDYINGRLKTSNHVCSEHAYEGHCNG
ncbi:MAG TPA: NifB/NifX family molybdenum-iron cluster-binding protein [Clostridia bacterium]|nr:NifB/NifX family molybdenum-iron cluster-binding protein [Clostridia bacterium]